MHVFKLFFQVQKRIPKITNKRLRNDEVESSDEESGDLATKRFREEDSGSASDQEIETAQELKERLAKQYISERQSELI